MQSLIKHPLLAYYLLVIALLIAAFAMNNVWLKGAVLVVFWGMCMNNAAKSLRTWRTKDTRNMLSDSVVGLVATGLFAYFAVENANDWLLGGIALGNFCNVALDFVLAMRRRSLDQHH
jgi:phosphatidylglycerophosphatase A